MKVVQIQGPSGTAFAVFEVVVESEGEVVSFLRSPDGGDPREARGRYASTKEAMRRNNRATTSASLVDVADIGAARALVL